MLPTTHYQTYQESIEVLIQWQMDCQQDNFLFSPESFFPVQQVFQQKVFPLTADKLDSVTTSRWQSLQTEIYRTFKLLQTEIIFLASSRQTHTREQRLKSIHERTEQLLTYCQAMLH